MAHECKGCKYYYKTERVKTKEIYNALSDRYEAWISEKKNHHACGNTAGGTFLDDEQPKCSEYEINSQGGK